MKKAVYYLLGIVLAVFFIGVVGRVYLRKNAYTLVWCELMFGKRLFSDQEIAKNLTAPDRMLVINSLSILSERGSTLGIEKARELLESETDWVHGALYLAQMGDRGTIPYLIAALGTHATGLHKRCADYLAHFTGQNFGPNYLTWRRWWEENGTQQGFDFDRLIAGARAARERQRFSPDVMRDREMSVECAMLWVRLLGEQKLDEAWGLMTKKFREAEGSYEAWKSKYLSVGIRCGIKTVEVERVTCRTNLLGRDGRCAVSLRVVDGESSVWLFNVTVVEESRDAWKVESFSYYPPESDNAASGQRSGRPNGSVEKSERGKRRQFDDCFMHVCNQAISWAGIQKS